MEFIIIIIICFYNIQSVADDTQLYYDILYSLKMHVDTFSEHLTII